MDRDDGKSLSLSKGLAIGTLETENDSRSVSLRYQPDDRTAENQHYDMEGGQPEISHDGAGFNSCDYSLTSSLKSTERAQRITGNKSNFNETSHFLSALPDNNEKSLIQKMKKKMLKAQGDIDRRIKRPIEFRIFYWMDLVFLLIQTLVYSGAAFRIDSLTDLSHKAEDTQANAFVRLLV